MKKLNHATSRLQLFQWLPTAIKIQFKIFEIPLKAPHYLAAIKFSCLTSGDYSHPITRLQCLLSSSHAIYFLLALRFGVCYSICLDGSSISLYLTSSSFFKTQFKYISLLPREALANFKSDHRTPVFSYSTTGNHNSKTCVV